MESRGAKWLEKPTDYNSGLVSDLLSRHLASQQELSQTNLHLWSLWATPTLAFLTQESQPGNPFLEGNHWPDSLYQHPDIVVNYKHTGPTWQPARQVADTSLPQGTGLAPVSSLSDKNPFKQDTPRTQQIATGFVLQCKDILSYHLHFLRNTRFLVRDGKWKPLAIRLSNIKKIQMSC